MKNCKRSSNDTIIIYFPQLWSTNLVKLQMQLLKDMLYRKIVLVLGKNLHENICNKDYL